MPSPATLSNAGGADSASSVGGPSLQRMVLEAHVTPPGGDGKVKVQAELLSDAIAECVDAGEQALASKRPSGWRRSVTARADGSPSAPASAANASGSAATAAAAAAQSAADAAAAAAATAAAASASRSSAGRASNGKGGGPSSQGARASHFGVSRLSLPAVPTGGEQDRVRYIHIPKHAMKDFRDFAKGVAAQACREVATSNPYVQALNKHRAELQSPLVVSDDPQDLGNEPTLEQQLSTKREALSMLSTVRSTSRPAEDLFTNGCGYEVARLKSFGLFGKGPNATAQCCTSRGDLGEAPLSDLHLVGNVLATVQEELVVYPLPTLVAGGDFSPPSATSALSARSALSTTCSRHSVCEEGDSGGLVESSRSSAEVPQRQQAVAGNCAGGAQRPGDVALVTATL